MHVIGMPVSHKSLVLVLMLVLLLVLDALYFPNYDEEADSVVVGLWELPRPNLLQK